MPSLVVGKNFPSYGELQAAVEAFGEETNTVFCKKIA